MNVLYARNEHQGILIVCPHCKMGVRHDSDDIGDAIKEAKPITCAVCEKRFTLAIFAVIEEAVEQPLAPDGLKSWGILGKCTICGKAWEDCSCLTRRW